MVYTFELCIYFKSRNHISSGSISLHRVSLLMHFLFLFCFSFRVFDHFFELIIVFVSCLHFLVLSRWDIIFLLGNCLFFSIIPIRGRRRSCWYYCFGWVGKFLFFNYHVLMKCFIGCINYFLRSWWISLLTCCGLLLDLLVGVLCSYIFFGVMIVRWLCVWRRKWYIYIYIYIYIREGY